MKLMYDISKCYLAAEFYATNHGFKKKKKLFLPSSCTHSFVLLNNEEIFRLTVLSGKDFLQFSPSFI